MAFEMGKQSNRRVRVATLILGLVGLTLAAASVPVSAQVGWREPPVAALDRHIRVLAKSPKDFLALIGAGEHDERDRGARRRRDPEPGAPEHLRDRERLTRKAGRTVGVRRRVEAQEYLVDVVAGV